MRVVHIAPTPFGAAGIFGGGERYPLELARALAGHVDCDLVTFGARPGVSREPGGLRVRVLRPALHLGHPAHPVALRLPAALTGADVVHAHHMRSVPSRTAALVARARRQPVVVTDHGLAGGSWGGILPRLFHRFLTVSEFSAWALGAPASRTRVIYGGVDCERFRPDPDEARSGVLFVGRLTPHKGVDRLLAALPDGVQLTVVGTGGHDRAPPERDYPHLLARLAAGKDVRFLGAVPDDRLPTIYRRAAALVVPSVHVTCFGRRVEVSELLGLAALEAMASGTPVIASRVGGLAEVVADGVTGFLVAPGELPELRDRIAGVVGDRRLAQRLGEAGRERARQRFTWSACAERCLAAYSELTGPR